MMTAVDKKEKKEKKPALSSFDKDMNKKYGNVFIPVSQIVEKKTEIVPVTPNLDIALNGGIPEGSWSVFSGAPKAGKTTLALTVAANGQKLFDKKVFYLDVEGRLKKMNLQGIPGLMLDPEHFCVIQSTEDTILSAENFLNIAQEIIKAYPRCIIIIDSTSALCSAHEMENDITGQTRALGPKILASFCRQMGTVVPIQQTMILMIQHLIANTSGMGPKYMEDSGRKVQYQKE